MKFPQLLRPHFYLILSDTCTQLLTWINQSSFPRNVGRCITNFIAVCAFYVLSLNPSNPLTSNVAIMGERAHKDIQSIIYQFLLLLNTLFHQTHSNLWLITFNIHSLTRSFLIRSRGISDSGISAERHFTNLLFSAQIKL